MACAGQRPEPGSEEHTHRGGGEMSRNRCSSGLGVLARSFIVLATTAVLPAAAFGSTVEDCFKTVSGYNAFKNTGADGMKAVAFAIEHPSCVPPVVSLEPSFVALTAALVLAKEAGVFSSWGQCQAAVSGPAKKAIAGFLKESLGAMLPADALATLQAIAEDKSDAALTSIPVLGQLLSQLPCSCSVAFSGLSITELSAIIKQEANGIKACGGLLSGAVSTMLEGMKKLGAVVGLSCAQPKMNEHEYYQQFLAPLLNKYALATDNERHVGCYNHPTGSCRADCINYYMSGSAACRMESDNANHLCDVIFTQFDPKVMALQPILVAQALATCSPLGDGCVRNKNFPELVIDTYGQDTHAACLGVLKNTFNTPGCKPTEQPCCWRAPWPPALKCKKARAEAASRVGNLAGQIEQGFNKLPTTSADAQMIADRQACQQAILGSTLKYVQDAACAAAAKTATDDFSGIWPDVLKQAIGVAVGEAYTKCDGPYNKRVKINGCKDKCAQPATLKALYRRTDSSAATQCYDDCMSGRMVGKMRTPAMEQSQSNQQANCLSQCFPLCDGNQASAACINCKNACSSGPGPGAGSIPGGAKKPRVGPGGGVVQ